MRLLEDFLLTFLDALAGHMMLAAYLFSMMEGRSIRKYLRKLPFLTISPLLISIISIGVYVVAVMPKVWIVHYAFSSLPIILMCTIWVRWAWSLDFWRALSSVCMGGILQIATSALVNSLYLIFPFVREMAMIGISIIISFAVAFLLKKLHFDTCFCLLLAEERNSLRTALLIFALEFTMEILFTLQKGVQSQYLAAYYLMVVALVSLMLGFVIYLAQQFETSRKLQAQQDVIAQQQIYEQDLEVIRQEVRAFRHDYKNLLAGLSQQAGAGELEELCAALSELDAGFDQRLGEKIQASTQIGNLQIPQVRSLLLSKLTAMRKKGVECRLEVLYPINAVGMDIWDLVRCMGILIDNAVEAAEETEHPWVEIILLAQENRVDLRVSNPWNREADPSRFWEEGWSTKGTGRGLGLSGYLRILEHYTNVSPCTSWADGIFVQELSIGDHSSRPREQEPSEVHHD